MTTLFLTIITVSSILLIAGFILVYGGSDAAEDHVIETDDTSELIKPYNYTTHSEISGENLNKLLDESEEEFIEKSAQCDYSEEFNKSLFEQQFMIAKNKDSETHLRMRAGQYLLSFNSMPFLDEIISRLAPEDQNCVYESINMSKTQVESKVGEKPWESDLKKL